MRALLLVGLLISVLGSGCGGRSAGATRDDGAVPEGEGEEGDVCDTDADCEAGLHCLYWNPGCELRGVCGAVTWGWDALVVCQGACDCNGQWRGGGLTNFPFQFRHFGDPSGAPRCEPIDAGPQTDWDPYELYSSCPPDAGPAESGVFESD